VLPSDNFSIQVSGETCVDTNNGQISISANETHPYTLTINGESLEFTNNKIIEGLSPGEYTLCVQVPEVTASYCYVVNIGEAAIVAGKTSNKINSVKVNITQGTAPFKVYVNGDYIFKTTLYSFSVDVKHGDLLAVNTDKLCEGSLERTVDLFDQIVAYPNPTDGFFELTLPVVQQEVQIAIYSMDSQFVSRRIYPVVFGKVKLSIADQPAGVYVIKIESDIPASLMIVKK